MAEVKTITYAIQDPVELNLSYMPFIEGGGIFIPSFEPFSLGERVAITLTIPGKAEELQIEGKIIWITPQNALHHVLPGIGVQFVGSNASVVRGMLEASLDKKMEVGGYTYGITDNSNIKE